MAPTLRKGKVQDQASAKKETQDEVDAPRSAKVETTGPEQPVPFTRPRASYVPALFFAATFLFKSFVPPTYNALKVLGLFGRGTLPSAYTAPGVSCAVEALDGPKFCEHEIVFEEEGVVLLSCDPGRGEWNTVMGPLKDPGPRGKLWLYDYANTKRSRELALDHFPVEYDFHPLGIAHFSDALKTTLFVINHRRTGPSIESFSIDPSLGLQMTLKHENTVPAQADIRSANGLVALDHKHLYVTNDHAWTRLEAGGAWAMTETLTGPIYGRSWVTHIDLSQDPPLLTRSAQGLPFANGIASGQGGTIYVASSSLGSVQVLERTNASSTLLRKKGEIQFGYAIDNVHVFASTASSTAGGRGGDVVLVGGHPSFLSLVKLAANPHADLVAPSWLSLATARTETETEKDTKSRAVGSGKPSWHAPTRNAAWDTRTLYQDDGHHFSSSTGAAVDSKRDVLVGTGLYETGVLVCRGVRASSF